MQFSGAQSSTMESCYFGFRSYRPTISCIDFMAVGFNCRDSSFDIIHYAGMGIFKLGIILLNLVPYTALRIVG